MPNLVNETKRVPISSVVLSGQWVEMKEAAFNAGKDKVQLVNPLVHEGKKLIPSVTRVFRGELLVFLQAYSGEALGAYVTLYRDGKKAAETAPLMGVATEGRLRILPMQFLVPLEGLAVAEYLCQVTVVEANGAKAAFWQALVMVAR